MSGANSEPFEERYKGKFYRVILSKGIRGIFQKIPQEGGPGPAKCKRRDNRQRWKVGFCL
jgi:hypothetical protein